MTTTYGSPSPSTRRRKAADEPTVPAAFPPWVMLEHLGTNEVHGCCASSVADNKTLAGGHTSTGLPISVSLCLAPPPQGSRVCAAQLPAEAQDSSLTVLAAHGDSVLVGICLIIGGEFKCTDYFVYNAGGGNARRRPPSLLLLPAYNTSDERQRPVGGVLDGFSTGLLRSGGEDDEFVVAKLKMVYMSSTSRIGPELLLFRSGEWCVKRPAISHCAAAAAEKLASSWRNNMVVPIGDELLCWVDLSHGLLFSDVFADDPGLRFVPIPDPVDYSKLVRIADRNVCVTAGDAIKFVDVAPRCCCGGAGVTYCARSHHAYTIRTWTLRMDDDMASWEMDGILDAAQLWALDGYKGLPRVELDYPVVSMDDPHAICFVVCEMSHQEYGSDEEEVDGMVIDKTAWRIMVDMRRKTLKSVSCYPEGASDYHLMPSRVSDYFNSEPSSSMSDPALAQLNMTRDKIKLQINNTVEPIVQPVCEWVSEPMETTNADSQEAKILAALQEIPGLDRDDMLKAYRILSHDDSGRRFRSLMGLPMNLRKDYVLMDIKATEACVICSSCSDQLQL